MKRLRTLKSFKIFKSEIKKLKTYSDLCAFKGLSNDTTLIQIQSGRTVPLNQQHRVIDHNKEDICLGLSGSRHIMSINAVGGRYHGITCLIQKS
jgi:hypothetical protein